MDRFGAVATSRHNVASGRGLYGNAPFPQCRSRGAEGSLMQSGAPQLIPDDIHESDVSSFSDDGGGLPPGYEIVDEAPPQEQVSGSRAAVDSAEVWGGSNWASTAVLKASLPNPSRIKSERVAESPASTRCHNRGKQLAEDEVWGGSNWANTAALHAALPTPCRKRADGAVSRMASQGEYMCATPSVPRTAAGRGSRDRMSPPSRQAPSTAKAEKKRSLYSAPPVAGPRDVDLLDVLATPPVSRSRGCSQRQPTVIESDLCGAMFAEDGACSPAGPRTPCPPRELFSIAASPLTGKALTSAQLEAGRTVRIHGLQVAVDYNGMCGTVESWDDAHRLWMVRLGTGELKSLSADNLEIVDRFAAVRHARPERQYSIAECVTAVPTVVDRLATVPTPVLTSPGRLLSVNSPPGYSSPKAHYPPPQVSVATAQGGSFAHVPRISSNSAAMPRSPLVVPQQHAPSHSTTRATVTRQASMSARARSAGPPVVRTARPHVLPRPDAEPKSAVASARARPVHGSPRVVGAASQHSSARHLDGRRSPAHSPSRASQAAFPAGARSPSYRPPVPPHMRLSQQDGGSQTPCAPIPVPSQSGGARTGSYVAPAPSQPGSRTGSVSVPVPSHSGFSGSQTGSVRIPVASCSGAASPSVPARYDLLGASQSIAVAVPRQNGAASPAVPNPEFGSTSQLVAFPVATQVGVAPVIAPQLEILTTSCRALPFGA